MNDYRYHSPVLIFLFVLVMACGCGKKVTIIDEITSEKVLKVENNEFISKEYFAVTNPPVSMAEFRALIDKNIAASLANIDYKHFHFKKRFYRATDEINKDFSPHTDPWCFLGCNYLLHIWDDGYDERLALVSIEQNSCYRFTAYRFYHRDWFWQELKGTVFYVKEILDAAACKR